MMQLHYLRAENDYDECIAVDGLHDKTVAMPVAMFLTYAA